MVPPELKTAYQAAFDHCKSTVGTVPTSNLGGPASPLCISPPEGYFESKLKVMYFGQETNGWEQAFCDSPGVEHLLEVYNTFANGGQGFRRGGHFWNGIRHFQSSLSESEPSTKFLYNNLVKIGKHHTKGRPSAELLEWQDVWFDVIRAEVKLLEPDVIVFFTGPLYDDLLRRVFGDVQMEFLTTRSTRQLSRVKGSNLPHRSFRTYHPKYLWANGFHSYRAVIMNAVFEP